MGSWAPLTVLNRSAWVSDSDSSHWELWPAWESSHVKPEQSIPSSQLRWHTNRKGIVNQVEMPRWRSVLPRVWAGLANTGLRFWGWMTSLFPCKSCAASRLARGVELSVTSLFSLGISGTWSDWFIQLPRDKVRFPIYHPLNIVNWVSIRSVQCLHPLENVWERRHA